MAPHDGAPPTPTPATVSATVTGLGSAHFSDCTLRVCLDAGCTLLSPPKSHSRGHPPSSNQRRTRVRDVPVCSLVLAAKSEYFRVLLTGSFQEGRRKERVDIHVPEDGEASFLDLLFFLYNGELSPSVSTSPLRTLKLLALSDILDTRECFSQCVSLLKGALPSLTPTDALHFLHLPPLIQERPCLAELMDGVKKCVVRGHSTLFRAPYSPRLYKIPEYVLTLMLESDELVVESEDEVLEASKAWVKHNFPENEIEALCRVVLPRLRHLSLSPQALLALAQWEKQLFFGIDSRFPEPSASTWPAMSAVDDWDLDTDVAYANATSAAVAEAHEASLAALLALSEKCFLEYGAVAGGRNLSKYLTGRSWKAPRNSCMPPCGRIYLDIPFQFCTAWEPADDDLACSAPTLVSGRWLELKAQYHSDLGTLGLWLAWHRHVSAQESTEAEAGDRWRARCKFCVMTEASAPAYQTLQSTVAEFEVEVSCWGVQGALNMASILEESSFFFPQGALRIRADIWVLP